MYIPMIFFTIVIEKRKWTPEQREAKYRQRLAIAQLEERKRQIACQYPEFWFR
ncbi:YrzI family small protein [Brevibacillus brevis]|uniref:YrzI family small protein n=1 Tax=Brevibacillus brevis TaxID=1393 RepID=A0ABY9T7L5_BREBE|nr:YrzI family small protein [Brevibacillus brevis]WNC15872.1 YrzI family small protein [Brevibacillus brevis]